MSMNLDDLTFDLPGEMQNRETRNVANAIQYMTTWPMKCMWPPSPTLRTAYSTYSYAAWLFSCSEAGNSSRGKLSSFLTKFIKRGKTVQTNMVVYVVWAINFKSEFRSDFRGCLKVTVASKPHFLCWSPIKWSCLKLFSQWPNFSKIFQMILQKS